MAAGNDRHRHQSFLTTDPTSQHPASLCATVRFNNSLGKQSLMPPKVKNQTKAKTSYNRALVSSIRAASRKARTPATPNSVTAQSAIEAVRALALRPILFPSMSSTKGMVATA
jgi:hypothetical protein